MSIRLLGAAIAALLVVACSSSPKQEEQREPVQIDLNNDFPEPLTGAPNENMGTGPLIAARLRTVRIAATATDLSASVLKMKSQRGLASVCRARLAVSRSSLSAILGNPATDGSSRIPVSSS